MKGSTAIAEILKREGTKFLACYRANALIQAWALVGIRPVMCRQGRVGMVGMDPGGEGAYLIGPSEEKSFWKGSGETSLQRGLPRASRKHRRLKGPRP